MRLKDLMKTRVATVQPNDSVRRARSLMQLHGVRHLPVMEGSHVVGVVSQTDVTAPTFPGWSNWEQVALDGAQVTHVMSSPAVTLPSKASAHEAANIMRGRKIGCIPIVREGERLVGIVTATDILEAFSRIASTSHTRVSIRARGNKR